MRFRPDAPLFDRGYVCGMVVQHEHEHQHQHDETMLATDQLRRGAPVLPADDPPPPDPGPISPAEVRVPAGPFLMGTATEARAYDNEHPHTGVRLPAYWIDTVPVSNAAYRSFVDAGATTTRGGWHPDGWTWRCTSGQRAPSFWLREGGRWLRRRFRAGRDVAGRGAGAARLLVRGRRVRPPRRRAPAHRGGAGG